MDRMNFSLAFNSVIPNNGNAQKGCSILVSWIGWDRIKPEIQQGFIPKASIVIAMRNEEKEVIRLISSLYC